MNELAESPEPTARRGRKPAASVLFNLDAAIEYCSHLEVDQVVILTVPDEDDEKYVVRRMAACFKNKYRNHDPMPIFGCKSAANRLLVWRTE